MAAERPVCTNCEIEMRCAKNGYIVGYSCGRRYSSDRYACPECGASVAILARLPYPEPPANGVPITADCIVQED